MTIEYKNIGKIELKANKQSRRITARYKDGGFRVTYPYWMKIADVEKSLSVMEPRLLDLKERSPKKHFFTPESMLQTYSFDIKITESGERFYMLLREKTLFLVCPEGSNYQEDSLQSRIQSGIETALRKEAKRLFPEWIETLARENGFNYNSLKINKSKSRWGSCSTRKNINLSYFCLLLPHHLIEYIILHELCHTVEMNHSEHFWALLNKVTKGKALLLKKEIKGYKTAF